MKKKSKKKVIKSEKRYVLCVELDKKHIAALKNQCKIRGLTKSSLIREMLRCY